MADHDLELVLKTVFGLIALTIAIVVAMVRSRTIKGQLRQLAATLGGRVAGNWFNEYIIVDSQGTEARIKLRAKSRNSPSQLRLELAVLPRFRWTIQRTGFMNISIRFDDLRKLENPMPQLGNDLKITVNDQMQAMMFFADANNQAAIREFFDRGFTELGAGKSQTIAFKNNYEDRDLDPARIRTQLEALRRLATT
jgi:hypothetical protein